MPFSLPSLERQQAAAVASSCCRACLDELKNAQPGHPLAASHSWDEVRAWLEDGGVWREEADRALLPLLHAYKTRPDQAWHDILLYLFWRQLVRFHRLFWQIEPDEGCRFSLVYWTFLRVLERLEPERRRCRLGAKILQDLRHDLRQHYAKESRQSRSHLPLAAELDDIEQESFGAVDPGGAEDPAFLEIEFRHDRSWAIARLKELVRRGQLSRPGFLILVGSHLYGHTIEEMAERLGLQYPAAKQRRLRALKSLQESAPDLFPDLVHDPLMSLKRAPRKEKRHGRDV